MLNISDAVVVSLRSNLSRLSQRDSDFARSLLGNAAKYRRGFYTDGEAKWIRILSERATAVAVPSPVAVPLDNVKGVVELLRRPGSAMKRPKMVVRIAGSLGTPDVDLRLTIATVRSRVPGSVNVTSAESDYEGRDWYGRILPDSGVFEPSRRPSRVPATAIVAALKALAADPTGVASAYGKLTGRCCFCSIPLSDARSTAVGYGERCAQRYGLPWGSRGDTPVGLRQAA